MGIVSLKRRGLIYQGDFSVPSLEAEWEVLPNNPARLSLHEVVGSLRLKHGESPLYLFYTPLSTLKEFVLDVRNAYNHKTAEDTGGLTVFSNAEEFLMLEEYFDSAKGTAAAYPWVRLVRDHNQYSFYWSEDRVSWNILGSEGFDVLSPKIGIYLHGASGEPMDVSQVTICRSTQFEVSGIGPGTRVLLKDASGNLVAEKVCRSTDTAVHFDTSGLPQPFSGKLDIVLRDGETFSATEVHEIWGGDQYAFEPNVDLFFVDTDGKEVALESGIETFLGFLNPGSGAFRNIQMVAKNLISGGSLTDVMIRTADYKQTAQYTRLISLAVDNAGIPGSLGSSAALGTVEAGGSVKFWLQVRRETDAGLTGEGGKEAYFGLSATAAYTN